jgi:hypothetical protein
MNARDYSASIAAKFAQTCCPSRTTQRCHAAFRCWMRARATQSSPYLTMLIDSALSPLGG